MFFRKEREEESPYSINCIVEQPKYALELTVEEMHAYNCLIYSNENAGTRLKEFTARDTSVTVLQAHYAAWLIESKSYTGIDDNVALSLLEKLRENF